MNNYGYLCYLLFSIFSRTNMSYKLIKLSIDELLTQWDLNRAQEHSNRSSDGEDMTFRSWRSYVGKSDELTWIDELTRSDELIYHLGQESNIILRHMNVFLTQWAFHRVQEHSNRSSNGEDMTFRSWRSYVGKSDELTWIDELTRSDELIYHLGQASNILLMHINVFLTQWAFHRVQEHPNWSSNGGVMTFQSWRSYVVKFDELTWIDELSSTGRAKLYMTS